MSDRGDEQDDTMNIFNEPADFYEPEKGPTFASHTTSNGQVLSLRLIGHSPLWGHLLWNAGRTLATYLETHAPSLIDNKSVLELGAGAGLPSLICALQNAKHVVVTDYPDADLIDNLRHNINDNSNLLPQPLKIVAEGYLWGQSTDNLTRHLPSPQQDQGQTRRFDLIILGDLLFNHSEHSKLISTVQQTLKRAPEAQALVFFTPYRPWLLGKDLAFFDLARDAGFVVEKVLEKVMDDVMFEDDPGDEVLRRTVFGYALRWSRA